MQNKIVYIDSVESATRFKLRNGYTGKYKKI